MQAAECGQQISRIDPLRDYDDFGFRYDKQN